MSNEEGHRFDRRLSCVKYPGAVVNEEKALETLGGIKNISQILSSKNSRLDLHFRPDDPFSKPCYGDREKVTGLLLKVRVPKKKKLGEDGKPIETCSYTVLGKVTESFVFKSLCDFQYLPQKSGNEETQESILEDIFPTNFLPTLSWLSTPNENLFLLPPALSRMDNPSSYCYRNDSVDPAAADPAAYIRSYRLSKKFFTQRIPYDEKESIPTAPLPAALQEVKARKIGNLLLKKIKEMFEIRPIWSKVALQIKSEVFNTNSLKYLLPSVAFYYMSGPWRLLWVRHGYDPRIDPEARLYQLVDYRVQSLRLRSLVNTRHRTRTIHLPHKHQKNAKGSRMNYFLKENPGTSRTDSTIIDAESRYRFKPGMIPPHRNMLYQVIDLEVKEIQDIVTKPVVPGTICHERFGWFSSDVFDFIRKVIDDEATAAATSLHGELVRVVDSEKEAISSDSDDSSLVILSSSEGESDQEEEELDVDDNSD